MSKGYKNASDVDSHKPKPYASAVEGGPASSSPKTKKANVGPNPVSKK